MPSKFSACEGLEDRKLLAAFVANINFQPASIPVPAGYVADTGATYAAHDNGTWQHFIVYTGTSEVNNTFAQWQANGYDTTGSTMSLDTAWPH